MGQATSSNGTQISRRFLRVRTYSRSGAGQVTRNVVENTLKLLSSGSRPSSTQAWPATKDSTSNTDVLVVIVHTGTGARKEISMKTWCSRKFLKTFGATATKRSMMNGLLIERMLKMNISIRSLKTMAAPSPGSFRMTSQTYYSQTIIDNSNSTHNS